MSVQRAIGVAVLAAAGCVGLYFASKSGYLDSWGLPYLEPWQVLTIVAWVINTAVIAAGGRLDTNTIAVDTCGDAKEQLPEVRYFLPAGWAFAIWGPIILGELALAVYQALPIDSVDDASGWLSQLSPWLAAAFLFQVCWCLSFREWAKDSGLLWFPAVMLFGAAVCLGGAHRVLRAAMSDGSIDNLEYFIVHLPVSLHFGWVSCATLVNLNTYIGFVPRFSDKGKLRLSLLSIAAAMCLAIAVTAITGDPIYAVVVAWALAAIASYGDAFIVKPQTEDTEPSPTTTRPNPSSPLLPGETERGVVISALNTQSLVAKTASVICLITAVVTPFV